MKLFVNESALKGSVAIPGSKSHTIRSVALAALAEGQSTIIAPMDSADTRSAVQCYRSLGAVIECDRTWRIEGVAGHIRPMTDIIDVGNSGTTLRFGIGSAALMQKGSVEFTGDDQIKNRPIEPLINSLNNLGARCVSKLNNTKAPVIVKGTLLGGTTSIEAVTSQYLSSLLINTPLAKNDSEIIVTKLNEQPYVEITLGYLDEQNIQYEREGMKRFWIKGSQSYKSFEKRIPADFSSATFFFCAGAITEGELILKGLDFSDAQGDKAVVDVLRQMGADIDIRDDGVHIRRKELHGIEIDMNAIPDALPALSVVGCFAKGQTKLHNVPQARLKETDRIAVMAEELKKMNADIEELPDGLIIRQSQLKPADVNGHHDHRVVMALAIAGMATPGQTTIDTAEAVSVTFPDFQHLMQSVGAKIETI